MTEPTTPQGDPGAIRARDARLTDADIDACGEVNAYRDRRTLLRMLDRAEAERDAALSLLTGCADLYRLTRDHPASEGHAPRGAIEAARRIRDEIDAWLAGHEARCACGAVAVLAIGYHGQPDTMPRCAACAAADQRPRSYMGELVPGAKAALTARQASPADGSRT